MLQVATMIYLQVVCILLRMKLNLSKQVLMEKSMMYEKHFIVIHVNYLVIQDLDSDI